MKKRPLDNCDERHPPEGEFLLYTAADGRTRIECRFDGQTIWLTQAQIAVLYQTTPQNITLHLKAIFAEGELDESKLVSDYVPELKPSAFSNATVREVMDMTTGLDYNENYADPESDIWQYAAAGDPAKALAWLERAELGERPIDGGVLTVEAAALGDERSGRRRGRTTAAARVRLDAGLRDLNHGFRLRAVDVPRAAAAGDDHARVGAGGGRVAGERPPRAAAPLHRERGVPRPGVSVREHRARSNEQVVLACWRQHSSAQCMSPCVQWTVRRQQFSSFGAPSGDVTGDERST